MNNRDNSIINKNNILKNQMKQQMKELIYSNQNKKNENNEIPKEFLKPYPVNRNQINNKSKTFTNMPNSIEYPKTNEINPKRYNSNNSIDLNVKNYNKSNEEKNNKKIYNREPDEVSTFSFFSNFNAIKKYSFYKNRKYICVHITILLLILCFSIGLLNLINYSWDNITSFFNNFLDLLSDPKHLIEVIFNFFYALFFGAIHYFYITIPLIIFGIILYLFFKRYYFKKRVGEIFKKIVQDMKDNISNVSSNNNPDHQSVKITEDDIYKRYFQKDVSYKRFVKKYLNALRKMIKDEPNMKLQSIINQGRKAYFWELSN
jgi:ABC-type multidrug transport system fused ATPase/permease subunit